MCFTSQVWRAFILTERPSCFSWALSSRSLLSPVPSSSSNGDERRRRRRARAGRRSAVRPSMCARVRQAKGLGSSPSVSCLLSYSSASCYCKRKINFKEFTPLNFLSGLFPHLALRGPGRGSIPSQVLGQEAFTTSHARDRQKRTRDEKVPPGKVDKLSHIG